MDTPDDDGADTKRRNRRRGRGDERPAAQEEEAPRPRINSGQYDATRSLRHTTADLTQAELRLRRLESFVTSDRYELQKELTKIERESERSHAG